MINALIKFNEIKNKSNEDRRIYIKEISLMKKYFSKPLRRYMYIYMKSCIKL